MYLLEFLYDFSVLGSQFPQEIQIILCLGCILDKCEVGKQQVLGLKLSSGQFSYNLKTSATPQPVYH